MIGFPEQIHDRLPVQVGLVLVSEEAEPRRVRRHYDAFLDVRNRFHGDIHQVSQFLLVLTGGCEYTAECRLETIGLHLPGNDRIEAARMSEGYDVFGAGMHRVGDRLLVDLVRHHQQRGCGVLLGQYLGCRGQFLARLIRELDDEFGTVLRQCLFDLVGQISLVTMDRVAGLPQQLVDGR